MQSCSALKCQTSSSKGSVIFPSEYRKHKIASFTTRRRAVRKSVLVNISSSPQWRERCMVSGVAAELGLHLSLDESFSSLF